MPSFEQEHHYGPQVHLIQHPVLSGVLAKLCSPETQQPEINRLVELLYKHLTSYSILQEFKQESFSQPTRMTEHHPGLRLHSQRLAQDQKVVCVNLARAGTFPTHICFEFLHYALPALNLRQDHIFAARVTDSKEHVTGTSLGSVKIGGDVKNAHVIIPDPMGATGATIVSTIDYYKKTVPGPAQKYLALHLIVTPEYLRRVLTAHPDVTIYALRLDRGLSSEAILKAPLGKFWDQEKGLNEKDYIVPGGGGFGEIMNNSYV